MATLSLSEYADNKTQSEVGRAIGVSRAAVSQMLSSDREIYVEIEHSGEARAWEKRYIPARRHNSN